MKGNLLIHYLHHNQSFQIFKNFLKDSCGLELFLLNSDGQSIPVSSSPRPDDFSKNRKDPAELSVSEIFFDQMREKASRQHSALPEEELREIQLSRGAGIIESAKCRQKKFVVPVIVKKEVAAFVSVVENQLAKLTDSQCKTLLLFLEDFTRRIVKAEIEFIEHFHDKDLTHQQCIIKEAVEYIHNNYHDSCLTLKDVSSQKNISYHYLSHLFKKELKVTFSSYVTKVRLDMAANLLKNKSLSVSQIAYQCGFEDPGYFSKTFKRRMGASPADYRSQNARAAAKSKNPPPPLVSR